MEMSISFRQTAPPSSRRMYMFTPSRNSLNTHLQMPGTRMIFWWFHYLIQVDTHWVLWELMFPWMAGDRTAKPWKHLICWQCRWGLYWKITAMRMPGTKSGSHQPSSSPGAGSQESSKQSLPTLFSMNQEHTLAIHRLHQTQRGYECLEIAKKLPAIVKSARYCIPWLWNCSIEWE